MQRIKLGSHVRMRGKGMFRDSVAEAASYGANTFMLYTGAPQNTRRKPLEELLIPQAHALMRELGMDSFVVHAPYLINLANTIDPEIFSSSVELLASELARTEAMGSNILILHPGSHVGAGAQAGIAGIVEGLNAVLTRDSRCFIALETMAGKGSEIGGRLEDLARIYDSARYPEKLRVCLDTCHLHDAGYDIVNDLDGVLDEFHRLIGREQAAVFHINDSKNPRGAAKDRHANIGQGAICLPPLRRLVHHPDYPDVPKILETPYRPGAEDKSRLEPPYADEINMLLASEPFVPEPLNAPGNPV